MVEINTLDTICANYGVNVIDFLKIDCEGAELDVLYGAKGLLQRHRIRRGMIEVCPGTLAHFDVKPEAIFDVFSRYGYSISWVEDPEVPLMRDDFRKLPAGFLGNAVFVSNWSDSS